MSKKPHELVISDMVQAVEEDREPRINGEAGRKAIEIIQAIYESARSGKVVTFPYKPKRSGHNWMTEER